MSNFFSENELDNITITEQDINNVGSFSRLNQDTKLEDLPNYEQLYQKDIKPLNLNEIKPFDNDTSLHDRDFKKQVDKKQALIRARVKLFVTIFLMCTAIITGFVIYNLVKIVMLNNAIDKNEIKLTSKLEQLENSYTPTNTMLDNFDIPKDINI